jgi:hypothetical protein
LACSFSTSASAALALIRFAARPCAAAWPENHRGQLLHGLPLPLAHHGLVNAILGRQLCRRQRMNYSL